ncbi:MAG: phage tail tape measure protein, partial [Gammaproteobacteria bacterium]|nr:phage tail tape measure protein [Gammaproteobacteria bacterium]
MATKSLGQLTIDVIAKVGGFVEGMDKAERSSAKWRKQVERNVESAARKTKWASGIAAAATVYWVKTSLDAAAQLDNLAKLAGTGTTEFQRYAAGSKTVGIENEKLADILKDVNDRVGDFLQTGGGPMADFFEKVAPLVGVTAQQFKNLSGADALGLYVDTLQKAGLNQQEMTFYMEAMASDASALIPLLKDGGREMEAFGDQAESLGLILSEDTIKAAKQFEKDLGVLGDVARNTGAQIGAKLLPEISDLTKILSDPETVKAATDFAKAVAESFTDIIHFARESVKFVQWAGEEIAAALHGPASDDFVRIEDRIEQL